MIKKFLSLFILFMVVSCGDIEYIEGPAGLEGDSGPSGEQGPSGEDGANGTYTSVALLIKDQCYELLDGYYAQRRDGNKVRIYLGKDDCDDDDNHEVELKNGSSVYWPDAGENYMFIKAGNDFFIRIMIVVLSEE